VPTRASSALAATARVQAFAHGRVPREIRRGQVLAVATDLFIERGFAAASMDELAKRAGVSKPVIYDLVGSKEALFGEICAQEATALGVAVQAAVSAEPDPDEKLHGARSPSFASRSNGAPPGTRCSRPTQHPSTKSSLRPAASTPPQSPACSPKAPP
jgi:AcrR family transcriptional regulator